MKNRKFKIVQRQGVNLKKKIINKHQYFLQRERDAQKRIQNDIQQEVFMKNNKTWIVLKKVEIKIKKKKSSLLIYNF